MKAAQAAFEGPWSKLSPTRRGRLMMRWGDKIAENAERIARIESEQNGKLLAEMRTQARIVQDWLYYFGGLADKVEGRVIPLDRTSVLNYTLQEPLGVIAAIVPWNSPTFLTIMTVAPALAAGNTIVIKPSEITSASAIELARLAEEAGFPAGVLNVVTGGRTAGEALVDHPGVAKISFTGSDMAGRAIAARAGQRLVGCTLELGGKSPNIVFDDADLDQAEAGRARPGSSRPPARPASPARARSSSSGSMTRLLERLVERAKQIRLGDPLRAETQMGPVATKAQLEKDERMVARAVEEGARVLAGGRARPCRASRTASSTRRPSSQGAKPHDFIMQNEVFGPVLSVTPFETEDEVVAAGQRHARSAWPPASGPATCAAPTPWPGGCRPARSGSTPIARWPSTRRSAATRTAASAARTASRRSSSYLQTKSVWCELSSEIQDPFVIKA